MRRILVATFLALMASSIGISEVSCREGSYVVPVQRTGTNADGSSWAEGEKVMKDGTRVRVKETYNTPAQRASKEKWLKKMADERKAEEAEAYAKIEKEKEDKQREATRAAEAAARRARDAAYIKLEQQRMEEVASLRKNGGNAAAVPKLEKFMAEGSPSCALLLGQIYQKGDGVKADKKKALACFQRAGRLGSGPGCYLVARAYLEGDGVEKDDKQAVIWLKASSALNAKHTLASMYLEGIGVEKNYSEAWRLFKLSSANDDPLAKASLGEMCYLGLGMRKNPNEAKTYFNASSPYENPKALFYLSHMYATGDGVSKDEARAKDYAARYERAKSKMAKHSGFELAVPFREFDALESRFERLSKESEADAAKLAGAQESAQTQTQVQAKAKPDKQVEEKRVALAKSSDTPEQTALAAVPKKSRDEIYTDVEELVKRFYPNGKISRSEGKLHFEFKTQEAMLTQGKLLQIPKLGGIFGEIAVTPGKYKGKEYLPFQTNDTLFVSLLMAPYSSEDDNHLLTKLRFPPDAPPEFIGDFKELVTMYSK